VQVEISEEDEHENHISREKVLTPLREVTTDTVDREESVGQSDAELYLIITI